jgi:hypothetical protein
MIVTYLIKNYLRFELDEILYRVIPIIAGYNRWYGWFIEEMKMRLLEYTAHSPTIIIN